MQGKEIDFKVDKYQKPSYLSKKDSIAHCINNALFMKKGNLPSHPDRGVDITQYLGKQVSPNTDARILNDLQTTCGDELVGSEINSLTFNMVNLDGIDYAMIIISIQIDSEEDIMAVTIERTKQNRIRYSYSFINEDVPI